MEPTATQSGQSQQSASHQVIDRLQALNRQFIPRPTLQVKQIDVGGQQYKEVIEYAQFSQIKLDYFNKQGWGYNDCAFIFDTKRMICSFQGPPKKYLYSGQDLPNLYGWAKQNLTLDFNNPKPQQKDMEIDDPKNVNHQFITDLIEKKCFSRLSFERWERAMHSHGASLREVYNLRYHKFERYVDCVVYPKSTEQVEEIVGLANTHNTILIPYGGGTNVTQALYLRNGHKSQEGRMIVSLDMSRMNKVLWIDKDNMIACCQAGIRGQDLERDLKLSGYVSGHEPDSAEYSTLGGWVSTRASGMKKNTYGNIEEIVQSITLVTPKGTFYKKQPWPRMSAGPDFNQAIMGHEGNLGVITDCIIRIRPIPQVQEFGSVVFPNFELGIQFMEEMSKQTLYPSSLRLVDNVQFQFGQALKPEEKSKSKKIMNEIKKQFLLKVKGFKPDEMVAATCLFEGKKTEVNMQMKQMFGIAKKYQGLSGGAENGIKGYQLTYMIAYIRDFCLHYNQVAESFETSCPWSQVSSLCKNVKESIFQAGEFHGQKRTDMFVSFRVTQLYETGAAVYVYFSMLYDKYPMDKVVDIYEDIENKSRAAVFKYGGCISHHHGVGKLRKRFMEQTHADLNNDMFKTIKASLDPKNIFAVNNTIYEDQEEKENDLQEKF